MSLREFMETFATIRVSATVINTTTKKEIRRGAKLGIIEFLEQGLVVELPSRACDVGHYLTIHLDVVDMREEKTKFITGSKVDATQHLQGDVDQVTLNLIQYDKAAWAKFQSLFGSRQTEIENFLKAAKG
jgi:hypothetical protein